MTGTVWSEWLLTAVTALIAVYFLARALVARRGAGFAESCAARGVDVAHAVMAAGMTAMFLPLHDPVPPVVWKAVFFVNAAWFCAVLVRRAARAVTGGTTAAGEAFAQHDLHHVVANVAMLYMVVATSAPRIATEFPVVTASGTAVTAAAEGAAAPGLPPVACALIVYFLAHSLWSGWSGIGMAVGRPAGRRACVTAPPQPSLLLQPGLSRGCQAVMGVGMSYMLLTML